MIGDVKTDVFAIGDVAVADDGIGASAGDTDGGADDRSGSNHTMIDDRRTIFRDLQRVVFMVRNGRRDVWKKRSHIDASTSARPKWFDMRDSAILDREDLYS